MGRIRQWSRRWLPQMQVRYCVAIVLLLTALLGLVLWRYCASPNIPETLDVAIQAVSAAAAAAAALIALALADPPKREILIAQWATTYLQTDEGHEERGHPARYAKQDISPERLGPFKSYPGIFHSYRVGFDLTNASGFGLRRPRLTITVPANRRHPRDPEGQDWDPTCNVLLGPTTEPPAGRLTEDRLAITAKLADDWGRDTIVAFWVRMVLDKLPDEPFAIDVAVTSDDAEGATCKITVPPDLIRQQLSS